MATKLNYGDIFESKNYGKAMYIGEAPKKPGSKKRRVYLKFINTGNIQDFELYEVTLGNFKDAGASKTLDYDPDYIWETQYGPVKIIEDLGLDGTYRWIKIRFLNTGYEKVVLYTTLQNNKVKDPFLPTVYGVGYYGSEKKDLNIQQGSIEKIIYHRWINMISRCYNQNDESYYAYGGIGVKVASEWHNFSTYLQDIKNKNGFTLFELNPSLYNIDKDYLQSTIPINQRIYSNATTIIIRVESNNELVYDIPTAYNAVWKKKDGYFYAKIYDPNSLFLLNYGPFDSIESAISFVHYKGILKFTNFDIALPNNAVSSLNDASNHFVNKNKMYKLI